MRRVLLVTGVAAASAALAIPLGAGADHRPGHTKPPTAGDITIAASNNPVPFPKRTVISGKLRGADAAGKTVELQHNPYPYERYTRLERATTNDKGEYSFRVRPAMHTRYKVTAPPRAESAELLVRSRMRINRRVDDRRPSRGQMVTFTGVVVPAHDGHPVVIQRLTNRGKWRRVATTELEDGGEAKPNRSVYSQEVKVRRTGVYRARVKRHVDHLANKSGRIRLVVR